jgi:Xaa-Pro dipeptidase
MQVRDDQDQSRIELIRAQEQAFALFDAIEAAGIIAPGRSEHDIERDIYALARRDFDVKRHWHQRIVRAGANTVAGPGDHPVRIVEEDDMVFVDLGPVFGKWEADVGKTYAFGNDPEKHRLCADLPIVFDMLRDRYLADPAMTGEAFYDFAGKVAESRDWRFSGQIAGHTVGEFMRTRVSGERRHFLIGPGNDRPMNIPDASGRAQHWIIEVHLASRDDAFAGFYERLMLVD